MDYSASINDPEHPAGASPWGNSPSTSPRHNRTAYSTATGDPPSSPFRSHSRSHSNNGLSDDDGFGPSATDYRRPDTASTVSPTADAHPSEAPASAEPHTEQERFGGPLSPQPIQQQQAPKPDQAQRSQEQQQPRKPPPPQFKLQAKITGLERTGRKDPILRFDVHVWLFGLARPATENGC